MLALQTGEMPQKKVQKLHWIPKLKKKLLFMFSAQKLSVGEEFLAYARGLPAVLIESDIPDRHWYGAKPEIIQMVKGPDAEKIIPLIVLAASIYPYQNR